MVAIAPFASRQHRSNAAVMRRLANEVAVVNGGDPFGVIFEMPYGAAFGRDVDSRSPQCIGPVDKLGSVQRGDELLIGNQVYSVQSAEPDGDGFVLLLLSREVS